MSADVVIRGGTVYDGTGGPGRRADVAISGGVIEEIGPNVQGKTELDASGCAVAPGFIDVYKRQTFSRADGSYPPAGQPSS